MSLYWVLKTLHLLSAIVFIGCVYMRTVVVPRIKPAIGEGPYKAVEVALAVPSRAFGAVNNSILAITGIWLYMYRLPEPTVGVVFKAFLGLLAVTLFFTAPLFVHRMEERFAGFKRRFHWMLLGVMVLIVGTAKWVFG
jgi:hypothetical protein